jgi:L-threonylcarbamoyladenylate synthase
MNNTTSNFSAVIPALTNGDLAVIPTDTLYGIVGQALNQQTVEKIYKLKGRSPEKPCIILISSLEELEQFGIELTEELKPKLLEFWPGPTSIILPCSRADLEYLHRGTNTLAFRMPNKLELIEVIKATGPLVAPSANPEGAPPAINIDMAKQYFGDAVKYLDGGELTGRPSTLIKIVDNQIHILRP